MRLPLLALGAALGLSACSGPAAPPSRATLEARVAASPDDVEALRDLGAFLAVDEQYGPALGPLTRARDLDPGDGQTLYLIGLVNEALERPDAAEDAYAGYLGVDADDTYRDSLRSRLDALVRQRLQTQFSAALVTEDTLADVTGTGAVGVLPFAYRGDNAEYAAIGRGLAEVVSVDLAATELDVVERIRLQALLAEYDLAREGLLDPATAPRAGRLLGADRLVGGEVDIQGEQLRIESAVWEGQLRDVTTAEGGLPELFRIQKETTLGVLTALGVEVTEAERAEILRVPTEDLVAFLLYSRALRREDRGDFLGAVQLYDEALARDP
ncbi:MAG: CsgG/HfaB family protein, partial [Bacteroidota bacterium]